jgi:hypothetical protein
MLTLPLTYEDSTAWAVALGCRPLRCVGNCAAPMSSLVPGTVTRCRGAQCENLLGGCVARGLNVELSSRNCGFSRENSYQHSAGELLGGTKCFHFVCVETVIPFFFQHSYVILKRTSVPGDYRDVSDVTHISRGATVSLSGSSLRPMFLTISEVHFNEYDFRIHKDLSATSRTSKRYMTSESMTVYLNQIVKPHCERLRREHNDDRPPVYLVMDNSATYNRQEHLQRMASPLVHPVWLSPHFTQCVQPLDVTLFGGIQENIPGCPRTGHQAKSGWQTSAHPLFVACHKLRKENHQCMKSGMDCDADDQQPVVRLCCQQVTTKENSV